MNSCEVGWVPADRRGRAGGGAAPPPPLPTPEGGAEEVPKGRVNSS